MCKEWLEEAEVAIKQYKIKRTFPKNPEIEDREYWTQQYQNGKIKNPEKYLEWIQELDAPTPEQIVKMRDEIIRAHIKECEDMEAKMKDRQNIELKAETPQLFYFIKHIDRLLGYYGVNSKEYMIYIEGEFEGKRYR